MNKKNLTIEDTLKGSKTQHKFFKGKWKPLVPENAVFKALWLVGELGEVIDILKKRKIKQILSEKKTRKEFIDEAVDCYMYLADVLNCFGVTNKEITKAYFEKIRHNMEKSRDYWEK
jgi:NTP pyrophosphatase (non-canonical NTP hydrolase)